MDHVAKLTELVRLGVILVGLSKEEFSVGPSPSWVQCVITFGQPAKVVII